MIYVLAIIFSVIFVIFIISLVINNKLEEKYSILWGAFAIMILFLSVFNTFIDKISYNIGVYYAPSLMFLCGFLFIIIYLVHLSIIITKQNKMLSRLVQEVAILKEQVESKKDRR